jgi:uncharacterized membrane protein
VEKERLLAFTDGVIAVIITIMVLEMKVPQDASLGALASVIPVFLSYVLSFVYVAIYWNNHHHFFHLVRHVSGGMLWANINLLFWVSLVPFATGWMGQNHFAAVPTALYGVALLMPALAWHGLQLVIIRSQGSDSALASAIGRDVKGKVSPALYIAGIVLAFVDARIAGAIYLLVALLWLIRTGVSKEWFAAVNPLKDLPINFRSVTPDNPPSLPRLQSTSSIKSPIILSHYWSGSRFFCNATHTRAVRHRRADRVNMRVRDNEVDIRSRRR